MACAKRGVAVEINGNPYWTLIGAGTGVRLSWDACSASIRTRIL
jgi:hypothetical protein